MYQSVLVLEKKGVGRNLQEKWKKVVVVLLPCSKRDIGTG